MDRSTRTLIKAWLNSPVFLDHLKIKDATRQASLGQEFQRSEAATKKARQLSLRGTGKSRLSRAYGTCKMVWEKVVLQVPSSQTV